jgi:hypothetical protein
MWRTSASDDWIRGELSGVGISDGPPCANFRTRRAAPPIATRAIGSAVHALTTKALKIWSLARKRGDLEIVPRLNVDYRRTDTPELIWNEKGCRSFR